MTVRPNQRVSSCGYHAMDSSLGINVNLGLMRKNTKKYLPHGGHPPIWKVREINET